MNKSFGQSDPRLEKWAYETYAPEDNLLREVRERSVREGLPDIQVAALDARHLEVLAAASGAKKAVEIGTLGGYSGISILRGMGPGGRLDTFELSQTNAAVAAESFRKAGLGARVRIHVGPALERLREVEADGPFDLVFIDADKEGYPAYLDWAADHLRVGGIVLGDNAFLFGAVPEEPTGDRAHAVRAMQEFHRTLASSGRFRSTILPTGEGLALGVRIK
jgi:caffeoyl-CoA O-methyltransferase